MSRPLGKRQLDRLIGLACPGLVQVVGDAVSDSLVRRGYLKAKPNGSFARITPAGLRRLADELEAGRIKDPVAAIKAKRGQA